MSEIGPSLPGPDPESRLSEWQNLAFSYSEAEGFSDARMNLPDFPALPETSAQVREEVLVNNFYSLQERLLTNPIPTRQELEIGSFVEEIQPQVRDAILLMREKGYDTGNVLHAGFKWGDPDKQSVALYNLLPQNEIEMLEDQGFELEDARITFQPEKPTDLGSIKDTWGWLADNLGDLGVPIGPAKFNDAVAFRRAAKSNTLLDFYMPNGVFNPFGTKKVRHLRQG